MPLELVMLSNSMPAREELMEIGASVVPHGTYALYGDDEFSQFHTQDGVSVLTVFASKTIAHREMAEDAIRHPIGAFSLWTEMSVPFGMTGTGRELAEAIAALVDGDLKERV